MSQRKSLINYPRRGRVGWRRWLPSWQLVLGSITAACAFLFAAVAAAVSLTPIPEPHDLAVAQTTIVYYDDGKTEIGRIGEANRLSVPLDKVAEEMRFAILAAEDRTYYSHGGFDAKGLTRAVWNNLSGGTTQGASTITQQYAKNAYLSTEQSLQRKFKELVLSVKLETQASKDEILVNYLNTIYYGRGAYGIQAASQAYFGKPASKLDLAESAYLASVIRAPSFYMSKKGQEDLEARWEYVLDGMVEQGWISQAEADAQEFPEPAPWRGAENYFAGPNGYLLDSVRRSMLDLGYTESDINLNGYRVTSTINKQAQDAAVASVAAYGPQYNTDGLRLGVASVRPGTGEVVAMYGGKNYLKDQFSDADQSIALAGSTFKPFALAAALENDIGLYSLWDGSSPRTIDGYTLENYGNTSYGTVTLLQATENSINTPYVEVGNTVGNEKVERSAIRAGIPKDTVGLVADPTTVLGTSSPTALDMADAYATFAARGVRATPTTIKEIKTADREVDYVLDVDSRRVFEENIADNVNYTLQRVVQGGTGTTALGLGRPAAGKTGTTDSNMSAWFVGYTPELATAVMMAKTDKAGNAMTLAGTGGLVSVTGGSFPAQVWTGYMRGALAGLPIQSFAQPAVLLTGSGSTGTWSTATPSATPSAIASASASESASDAPTDGSASPRAPSQSPPVPQPPAAGTGGAATPAPVSSSPSAAVRPRTALPPGGSSPPPSGSPAAQP